MKRLHLIHQRLTVSEKLSAKGNNSLMALSRDAFPAAFVGGTHLKHDLYLALFADHVGQYQFTKMGESLTSSQPSPSLFARIRSVLVLGALADCATELEIEPIKKALLCVANLHSRLEMQSASLWVRTEVSNVNRSLTVNDAGEIGDDRWRVLFPNVVVLWHENIRCKRAINSTVPVNKWLAAETNPRGTREGEVIVRPHVKAWEGGSKRLPRLLRNQEVIYDLV